MRPTAEHTSGALVDSLKTKGKAMAPMGHFDIEPPQTTASIVGDILLISFAVISCGVAVWLG